MCESLPPLKREKLIVISLIKSLKKQGLDYFKNVPLKPRYVSYLSYYYYYYYRY